MTFIEGVGDDGDPFDPADIAEAQRTAVRHHDARLEGIRLLLTRRREAYVRTFAGSAIGDDVVIVLNDLARFCRGQSAPWDNDPRVHALLTGRNEVYWRIQDHIQLDLDTLIVKYTTPPEGTGDV